MSSTLEGGSRPHRRRWVPWLIGSSGVLLAALVVVTLVPGQRFAGCLVVGCASVDGSQSGLPGGAKTTAHQVLAAQQAALLAGDEAAFVADVDPTGPALLQRFHELYATLRALQVTRFSETGSGPLDQQVLPIQTIAVPVTFRYCVSEPDCSLDPAQDNEPPSVQVIIRFLTQEGRLWISDLAPTRGEGVTPAPPWLTDRLVTRAGRRVVVAATPSLAGRLDATLAAGEQAAAVADRFARYNDVPGRYVVFLADAREFATWYGGPSFGVGAYGMDTAGFAYPVSHRYTHVVINGAERLSAAQLSELLRHEFGHVVTQRDPDELKNAGFDVRQAWAVEGVAEYIATTGSDPMNGQRRTELHRFLPHGTFTLDQLVPPSDRQLAPGFSAASLAAIRYLAQRYGETAMLRFVDSEIRHGQPPERISPEVFGKAWVAVSAEVVAAVHEAAG